MSETVARHIEQYTDKYIDGIFWSEHRHLQRGASCPTLFVLIGDEAAEYLEDIRHRCDKYYGDTAGIAYLLIGFHPCTQQGSCFSLTLPEQLQRDDLSGCRAAVAEYLQTDAFENQFYDKSMELLDYFMEYSDIYREGGVMQVFSVFCAQDPQNAADGRVEELLAQNISHIYAPNFTAFCLYNDIDARKPKLALAHETFEALSQGHTERQTVLLGSKKLNALFDRPREVRQNHVQLIVLTAFLKSGCENAPNLLQGGRYHALGIANLRILEQYVALLTLSNLYTRFFELFAAQAGATTNPGGMDGASLPVVETLDQELKKLETAGELALRQMRRALYLPGRQPGTGLTLEQAEQQLFGTSLSRYYEEQVQAKFEACREKTVSKLLEIAEQLRPDPQALSAKLSELLSSAAEAAENQKLALQSASAGTLGSLQLNINSNKTVRDLIVKHLYHSRLQAELLELRCGILTELLGMMKSRGRNLAQRRQALSDLGYEIQKYVGSAKISSAISNFYTDSIQNTIKLPPQFFERHLKALQEAPEFDAYAFLDSFCDSILQNDLYTSVGSADYISDSVIGDLLFDLEKKSSPYCFSLQIGTQAHTRKYYIGAKGSPLLKRLSQIAGSSVIGAGGYTNSISMVQVFDISDLETVNFVSACREAYLSLQPKENPPEQP
ncbi:hypothetical protein [Candidatus Soleaferrea massiliensis]|uniref:hypothetical protein n=1 Tax=Candidatus Soleaferrea massiliensis TaxID=1470354 RepID=UPI0005902D50|nr:hypothetical protein [Candidatus Soleaferrea massiliensis]